MRGRWCFLFALNAFGCLHSSNKLDRAVYFCLRVLIGFSPEKAFEKRFFCQVLFSSERFRRASFLFSRFLRVFFCPRAFWGFSW